MSDNPMKILISAVACNPYGSSESLHGWLVCRSLAELGELWLLVSAEHRPGVEKGRANGLVPENMHFVFVGEEKPYLENRLLARTQSWLRYLEFSGRILERGHELHERIGFDLSHHVTYSTWRVGNPLWRLNIPFIWGPISGTEVFPMKNFASILSLSAKAFELARIVGGYFSGFNPEVRATARNAFHIFAAHSEAVPHLAATRGTGEGISVLSYYTFLPETIAAFARPQGMDRGKGPLKILAGGNLEGRKGVAIALEGLALAKKAGAHFRYCVTGGGPELEHLKRLAIALGLEQEVILGEGFPREDYVKELQKTDLYLLPSLREGGGLTMMEAMLAGCVPIVADAGGPGTAVTSDCGVKVPVKTPVQMAEDIAAAVVRLDQDRVFLEQLSAAAPQRIAKRYAHESFIDAIRTVYKEALASKEGGGSRLQA
jgi:glycosyltransferase involved in cell wall biosynthesis